MTEPYDTGYDAGIRDGLAQGYELALARLEQAAEIAYTPIFREQLRMLASRIRELAPQAKEPTS